MSRMASSPQNIGKTFGEPCPQKSEPVEKASETS